MHDVELLRDYLESRSQDAFRDLVGRHLPMVYSAARRIVRDPQLAEEVAQSVFTTLARKAESILAPQAVAGWLYNTTRHLALNAVRSEQRRREREQTAVAMQFLHSDPDALQVSERLEPAMAELSEDDRAALVLRYLENRSLREVGAELGISEDAARMRVNRALDRLRTGFEQRGVAITTGFLGAAMISSTTAVPAGLPAAIATAALAGFGIPVSVGVGAGTRFFGILSHVSRSKLVTGLAAMVLVGVTTFMLFRSPPQANHGAASDLRQNTGANPEQRQQAIVSANREGNVADRQGDPDPLSLLQAVARARQRIDSGSMEFQVSVGSFWTARKETNQIRLTALFDGPKLRFEQFDRQYSYTYSADEAEQQEISKRADSMDRQAAVRAGLLKPFESHHAMAYDGTVLLNYWETDGKPNGTAISDPAKGTSSFIFDPRCLGLRTSLYVGATVESCLGYDGAKAIDLIGEELVEGTPAWHVQVHTKYDSTLDFWIDVARPTRVLKHASSAGVAISKYDETDARDPIPSQVTASDFRNGSASLDNRFIRTNGRLNVPVDPASFTLAGLGMQVGTPVTDARISRSLGYWTGAGLSEYPPPKKKAEAQHPPNLAGLLSLLETQPATPEALYAAAWILLNTPDGPEVDKAAEAIRRDHTRDTNLLYLCKELERVRHRCSKDLLQAVLKDNPSVEVRGTACFTLATLLKDEAKHGQNKQATAEAEKQYQRVITEFGRVRQRGYKLEDLARPELDELRRLIIGKPAPEIEGEDLGGQPMRLSDYRGRVVVLTFWWPGYSEAVEHRKLAERLVGKPVAFIGVYGDDDLTKAKEDVEKYGITWPSFRDRRDGPISKNWNVRGWPNIWVLDAQGVIRYKDVRGRDLINAVDTLLHELSSRP